MYAIPKRVRSLTSNAIPGKSIYKPSPKKVHSPCTAGLDWNDVEEAVSKHAEDDYMNKRTRKDKGNIQMFSIKRQEKHNGKMKEKEGRERAKREWRERENRYQDSEEAAHDASHDTSI